MLAGEVLFGIRLRLHRIGVIGGVVGWDRAGKGYLWRVARRIGPSAATTRPNESFDQNEYSDGE